MAKPTGTQTSISAFFAPKSGTPKKTADVVAPPSTNASQKPKPKPKPKASPKPKANVKASANGKGKVKVNGKKKVVDEDEDFEMEDEVVEEEISEPAEDDDDFLPVPRSNIRRVSSKRPIASISDGEEEISDTAPKRARKSPSKSPAATSTHATPSSPLPVATRTKKPVISARTARFALGSQLEVDEDPAIQKEKEKRHEEYVRKLGRGGIIRPSMPDNDNMLGEGEDVDEEDMEEEEAPPPKKGKGKAAAVGKKKKLTPMEQQIIDLKKQYPDVLLCIEVGYKFRFFGEDARTAAKELSVMCIPGKMRFDQHPSEDHLDKFASASFPVQRLHVHVKRLVEAGHKVGVVRQIETAALKAIGNNKNAPFVRKLTNLYTKGTYIDDTDALGGEPETTQTQNSSTGFLLCITEKHGGGSGSDERCRVGIVAVQPSTGDVVYDEFDDGFMRSEVETRLLHIAPCEFLIVGELTKATEKLVKYLAGSRSAIGGKVRVERVESAKNIAATSSIHVSKFYSGKLEKSESQEAQKKNALYESVMGLPEMVMVCLSAMINHLTAYGLEHVFDLTKYFQSFSARTHMLLNGNTLSSLEIYQNQTDYTEKGSLFWALDKTKTKFGRRLLRNWVGRPLLDRKHLEERLAAVEEMVHRQNPKIEKLSTMLREVRYDLEKGLIRIYYGKCQRPELLSVLSTMLRITETFDPVESEEDMGFSSPLINKAMASLPVMKDRLKKFLSKFDHVSAGKDDKYNFFKESDDYDKITEHKLAIVAIEHDLDELRKGIAKALGKKSVTYATSSGIEFLVEVKNDKASLKAVPASWQKISGTKALSRFHTPEVKNLIKERDQQKELLAAACDDYFMKFLAEISESYQDLRDTVQSLALLDCLLSLATIAKRPNYVKPTFVAEPIINIVDGRHPMIEQLTLDAYVPNSIKLSSDNLRALLVTGPNMGGKSSYVRQTALICIMAQIGSYVPAESAELGLLDAVFTRMGAFDNLLAGESTFMVELSETAEILKTATPRSLVILDELGRGTSTSDGVAIAYAVLEHMVRSIRAMTLFVTHYPSLGAVAEQWKGEVECVHMKFEEAGDGSDTITFLYQIAEGLAYRSYGLNVARLAGLPEACLSVASVKSRELEEKMRKRERIGASKLIGKSLNSQSIADEEIEKLIDCIGML